MSSTILQQGFSSKKLLSAFDSVRSGIGDRLKEVKKVIERLIRELSLKNPQQQKKIKFLANEIIENIEKNSLKGLDGKMDQMNELVQTLGEVNEFNIEEKLTQLGKEFNIHISGIFDEDHSNNHTFYENGDKTDQFQEQSPTADSAEYYETIINTYGAGGKKKQRNRRERQKRKKQLSKNSDEEAPKARRNRHLEQFQLEQDIIGSMKFSSKNIVPPSSHDIHSNSLIILENQRQGTAEDHFSRIHDREEKLKTSGWSKKNINSQKSIKKAQKSIFGDQDYQGQSQDSQRINKEIGENENNFVQAVENERTRNTHKDSQTISSDSNSEGEESLRQSLLKNSGKFNIFGESENIYSFRSSQNVQKNKQSSQKQINYSERRSKKSRKKNGDHPNYNITISQDKIEEMLKKIRNRVMVSCAVIDCIEFQRDSEGSNQRQIDNRVKVEGKNVEELVNLIGRKRQIWKSPGKSPVKTKMCNEKITGEKELWREVQNIRRNLEK